MSKIKLLLDVVQDMRSLADSLQAVADAVADNGAAEAELTTTKEPEKAGRSGKAVAKTTTKKDTKVEVRELLAKHGADKLSEIDPAEYAPLLVEAEVL